MFASGICYVSRLVLILTASISHLPELLPFLTMRISPLSRARFPEGKSADSRPLLPTIYWYRSPELIWPSRTAVVLTSSIAREELGIAGQPLQQAAYFASAAAQRSTVLAFAPPAEAAQLASAGLPPLLPSSQLCHLSSVRHCQPWLFLLVQRALSAAAALTSPNLMQPAHASSPSVPVLGTRPALVRRVVYQSGWYARMWRRPKKKR